MKRAQQRRHVWRSLLLAAAAMVMSVASIEPAGAIPCITSPCHFPVPSLDDPPEVPQDKPVDGRIKYTIQEQFGVTATEVVTGMSYIDNGSGVFLGDSTPGHCYESGFLGGWEVRSCRGFLTDQSPREIHKDIIGDYYHWTQPEYVMHAIYTAVPGANRAYCELDQGSLPPGWDNRCYSYRTAAGW